MIPRASRPLAALAFLAASTVVTSVAANAAVTLINRDDKDHKLTILEDNGAKTSEHMLKPSQVLEGICEKGCVIRLNDNQEDEYELEAGDKVSIEEGYLYYDEPVGTQQGAGSTAPPAAPEGGSAPKKP
ncbi:MAG: hypothetical protein R3D44_08970 [Hyphomicrobiaceae bacterium]